MPYSCIKIFREKEGKGTAGFIDVVNCTYCSTVKQHYLFHNDEAQPVAVAVVFQITDIKSAEKHI